MAYDKLHFSQTLGYRAQDWGAGADLDYDRIGPPNMQGKIRSIELECTETFAGSANTTLTIGTAAGGGQYLTVTLDAAGADAFTAGDVWHYDVQQASANNSGAPGNSASITEDVIAVDTAYFVSFNGGTGSLSAGIANVDIVIDWFF